MGVFLAHPLCGLSIPGLPHARGGVSDGPLTLRSQIHVFPTLVGVFPKERTRMDTKKESSPRSWGCFSCFCPQHSAHRVFPTLVGVFLVLVWDTDATGRAMHTGGVVTLQDYSI